MSNNRPNAQVFPLTAGLSTLAWIGGLVTVLTLDDPRLRFPTYAVAVLIAGIGWLGLIRAARNPHAYGLANGAFGHSDRVFWLAVGLGLVFRAWALGLPPAFSEDVFRYVYEGRVVWYHGLSFPFAHPPADAVALGVEPHLVDHSWLRINHPELSTIYPPLAQLTFVAAGGVGEALGGGHLWWLKALLVAADLATWAFISRALRLQGRPVAESIVWGLSPLVILEIAREAHADSLSTLGLSMGIAGFVAARPRVGYIGWALAALAKLNGLVVMPAAARTTRRGLLGALLLCAFVALPYLLAGGSAGAGLTAYASRWRAGDGAFSVFLELSGLALGGDWSRLESFGGVTLTRHQLARGAVAAAFMLWTALILAKKAEVREIPGRAGLLLLGLLLLSPTLHPWYVLWVLPFAAAATSGPASTAPRTQTSTSRHEAPQTPGFRGRGAVLLLALLAPMLHHAGWLELETGQWADVGWVRAMVHLPVWATLVAAFAMPRRTG